MSLTPEKQRALAIECNAGVPLGIYPKALLFYPKALAAYTAAVEAKERERCAKNIEEQISYSDAHTSEDLIIESALTTAVAQIRSHK